MSVVLVVDDHDGIRTMLTALLRDQHQVLEARDGREALAALATHTVDVLIIDIEMPVLSGRDVCEQVRADPLMRDIGIIVLTGSEIETAGTSLGADVLLRKPSGVRSVAPSVEALLSGKRTADDGGSRVAERVSSPE